MRPTTAINTRWRDRYDDVWRLGLVAATAFHAVVLLMLPRAISDRLHEALIPPPDVAVVAGAPGTELELLALAAPTPPAETPPPEPEPVEAIEIPVVAEVPVQETMAESVEAPSESEGVEEGVREGEGRGNPVGGGGGVATSPRPIHLVVPRLPGSVDKRRAHGEAVHLLVEVLADGTVGEVRVEKGSRIEQLNLAAVDAARRARYLPAMRDGVAVAQWTRAEMRF